MAHSIVWFDIPVLDLDRATQFYSLVMDMQMERYGPGVPVAVMSHGPDDVAGCLFSSEDARPSDHGPLLYFDVDGRIEEAASMVEQLGGKILEPVHDTPHGQRAIIMDSEGNRICLHSES